MRNSLLRALCTILCVSLVSCNDYTGIQLLKLYRTVDINNKGDVLIFNQSAGTSILKNGSCYKIPPPAGIDVAEGVDLNDNGDVLVHGYTGSRYATSFVCSNETCEELPVPQEWDYVIPDKMNNKGMVAGWAYAAYSGGPVVDGHVVSAFIYSNGMYTKLPLPVECTSYYSAAYNIFINDSGEVVFSYSCDFQHRTFMYKDGHYTELNLPGLADLYCRGISTDGTVLLYGTDSTSQQARSFIYSAGQYTELLPPGLQQAVAWHINDNGVAVGDGYDSAGTRKWFMYDSKEYTVRTLPGILKHKDKVLISGFNNNGVIVGNAATYFLDSSWYAFVTGFIAAPRLP